METCRLHGKVNVLVFSLGKIGPSKSEHELIFSLISKVQYHHVLFPFFCCMFYRLLPVMPLQWHTFCSHQVPCHMIRTQITFPVMELVVITLSPEQNKTDLWTSGEFKETCLNLQTGQECWYIAVFQIREGSWVKNPRKLQSQSSWVVTLHNQAQNVPLLLPYPLSMLLFGILLASVVNQDWEGRVERSVPSNVTNTVATERRTSLSPR